MLNNNNFYDLDEAEKTLMDTELIALLTIKIEAMEKILTKHGITNDLELEACQNYVKTLPHVKMFFDNISNMRASIEQYKANPQQHLQALFNAKLNGQVK